VQVDEPALVLDLNPNERAAFEFARLETKLGVYAGSHRFRRADQEADLAGANVSEQMLVCLGVLVGLHERDLRCRNANAHELAADPAVGGKRLHFSTLIVPKSEKIICAAPGRSN